MSKDIVWASNAMINPALLLFFRNILDDEPDHPLIDKGQRNAAGEVLSAENFPAEIWGVDEFKDNKPLPDIFRGYGPWIVSRKVADVMRQFDMGKGGFYPVRVLKKDRKTPKEGEWFCLNFGNMKEAYKQGGENRTPWIPEPPIRHGAPLILQDNQLTVGNEALTGPDIWVDPQIGEIFFVSDRLAKALEEAGVSRGFGFKKCRVI